MWACASAKSKQGGYECAALLLRRGASTEACEHTSRERRDALGLACATGQLATAQLLAGYGAIPRRRRPGRYREI